MRFPYPSPYTHQRLVDVPRRDRVYYIFLFHPKQHYSLGYLNRKILVAHTDTKVIDKKFLVHASAISRELSQLKNLYWLMYFRITNNKNSVILLVRTSFFLCKPQKFGSRYRI